MILNAIVMGLAGIIYGLFVYTTQKVQFNSQKQILSVVFLCTRLSILGLFLHIMLKSIQIHPIILIVSFLLGYWLIILNIEELLNGRS